MAERREVDLIRIGNVPRGSVTPCHLATVVFSSVVLVWMSVMEAIIVAPSANTVIAKNVSENRCLKCIL